MASFVRCKACGYITREKSLGDVCPACGVPRSSFEPYKDPLSPRRSFILGLDIHPIIVHFPQALTPLILVALIPGLFIDDIWGIKLRHTVEILAYIFPLSVIPAYLAGMLDGKTRFKKLSTPYLVFKLMLGALLFILASVIAFMVWRFPMQGGNATILLVLLLLALACTVALGFVGGKMMRSVLPGR